MQAKAGQMGVTLAGLFGAGRHWFAPALEQKTHWVGHSGAAAVLQGVAGKPARLLVHPGATVGRVGELVRAVPM